MSAPVEEPPVQEPVKATNGRKHRPSRLTPEQVDEILEAFKSDISTTEIQHAYGIGAQTLYTLVRRAGLPLRGQSKRLPKEETVSEPVKTSPPASPVQVEPASPNGVVSGLTEWVVTYRWSRPRPQQLRQELQRCGQAVQAAGQAARNEVVSVARAGSVR